MKKFLAFLASALLVAVCAVTMAACSPAKVKIIEISLSNEQYGAAIKKGNTELKTQVDEILTQLTGDGIEVDGKTVTFDSLYQAEKDAEANNTPISIGTVKTTSTNPANELIVATNAEFPPFEYMVGESFGGVDMQIAKIIANKLNKELVISHMDFEAVTNAVANDLADIGLAGLTISEERKLTVDFSAPYYDTTQYIAVAADNTDFDECKTEEDVVKVLKSLKGAKAGAAKAQTGFYYLHGNPDFEFEGFENITTTPYNTVALAVQDLANGTIQLVCGDKDTLTAAVNALK